MKLGYSLIPFSVFFVVWTGPEYGMVNARKQRCLHDSCTKTPRVHFEGKAAVFCKQHADDGMVNIGGQRCLHGPCTI